MLFQGFKRRLNLSKGEYLLLIIIILAASLVRLWDLDSNGFNNDEAIYSGQAATLAGHKEYGEHFSIYRAHPLLLQYFVSVMFANFGISDTIARLVPAILGIFTVIVTYMIGKILYDKKVAFIAAFVLALLSYHIIVSRQVMLDASLTFFFTLTLYFFVLHLKKPKEAHWLFLVGASAGLSFLSKEIGIFALITSIVCLFLIKGFNFRNIIIVASSFVLVSSPYWLPILTIPEAHDAALAYWNWQASRDPNQSADFYLTLISQEVLGYILTGLFILSVIYSLATRDISKPSVFILLVWIGIPLIIFQFLAVKGYAFASPTITPFVLLGVSFLFSDWMKKLPHHRIFVIGLIPLIFVFSGPMLHYLFQIPPIQLVGSGGEPYAREGAIWIRDNVPQKGIFLTIDIRTANVIRYYANNEALSLHSNNNPAYIQIDNPDLPILNGKIDYLVYETYLVEQFPYLKGEAKELNQLIIKYSGIPIHTEYETYTDTNGKNLIKPALIIYSLDGIKQD